MNKLVIDASNIVSGGGLTHLREFIKHAVPLKYDFKHVLLWAPNKTLNKLPDRKWLKKRSHKFLNKGYLHRFIWRQFVLKPSIDENTILFLPGTGYVSGAAKVVTMCQNLLPLDMNELNRYKYTWHWFRLHLLRLLHLRSFQKAEGVIFLNEYCHNILPENVKQSIHDYTIIPHGLNNAFLKEKKDYSINGELKLLNVSSVSLYRHQWNVAEAVLELKKEGYNVSLDLVGPPTSYGLKKLNDVLNKYPNIQDTVTYQGEIPYELLNKFYAESDAFIYSSTCETFGMTLLEAMGHSLPIICSEKSSMPGMIGGAGLLIDPESIDSIKQAIKEMMNGKDLRKELGNKAYHRAKEYSWENTADNTMAYLQKVAQDG